MFEGLLPIGSVVLLKDANKRLMIIGVCRAEEKNGDRVIWDYCGCYYPEGYISEDEVFLFSNDMIEHVYAVGFQDQEQFDFKVKADAMLKAARESSYNEE